MAVDEYQPVRRLPADFFAVSCKRRGPDCRQTFRPPSKGRPLSSACPAPPFSRADAAAPTRYEAAQLRQPQNRAIHTIATMMMVTPTTKYVPISLFCLV